MATEIKRAYLIAGDDGAKLDAALGRLRARAEREGGPGALESFSGSAGQPPDHEALIASLPAISLMAERRYLLADGVERWRVPQLGAVAEALRGAPEEVTVVLVARGSPPKALAEAVEGVGGELLSYAAPRKRELPGWLVRGARERGFTLAPQAARAMGERLGDGTQRLATELDRLAVWAGEGGEVTAEDIEELTADTSERRGWTLADAIVARDPERATLYADELLAQGEAVTPLVYSIAKRLRAAHQAASRLEVGDSASDVAAELAMPPYPARMLVRSVRDVPSEELSEAIGAIADLEYWTRGGSDYAEEVALTLAVRRAAGGEAEG